MFLHCIWKEVCSEIEYLRSEVRMCFHSGQVSVWLLMLKAGLLKAELFQNLSFLKYKYTSNLSWENIFVANLIRFQCWVKRAFRFINYSEPQNTRSDMIWSDSFRSKTWKDCAAVAAAWGICKTTFFNLIKDDVDVG